MKIPEGVEQTFLEYESAGLKEDADKRFEYFTKQVCSSLVVAYKWEC